MENIECLKKQCSFRSTALPSLIILLISIFCRPLETNLFIQLPKRTDYSEEMTKPPVPEQWHNNHKDDVYKGLILFSCNFVNKTKQKNNNKFRNLFIMVTLVETSVKKRTSLLWKSSLRHSVVKLLYCKTKCESDKSLKVYRVSLCSKLTIRKSIFSVNLQLEMKHGSITWLQNQTNPQ